MSNCKRRSENESVGYIIKDKKKTKSEIYLNFIFLCYKLIIYDIKIYILH